MTNLAHIANHLRREAERLYRKADYLDERELATDEYIRRVEDMAHELEEAANCIERYLEIKRTLSRRVLDVPPRAGRKPKKVHYEAYITVREGDEEEVEEVTV